MGSSPQIIFQSTDYPLLDALRARWLEVEIEQRAFVKVLTADRLLATVQYINLHGQTWQYPLWRQMYHLVNQSTYHRGQVSMMLSQWGEHVPTDFLIFHDELNSSIFGSGTEI
jgi:uncharacterized damage-inducible protein DinB